MNFYKFSKVSIFLISGILLACSPNKQNSKSNSVSQIKTQNQSNSHQATPGMKVLIDPDTGEFLEKPPENAISSETKTSVNDINLNKTIDKKPSYEEKKSTVPGGGVYIEMPAP